MLVLMFATSQFNEHLRTDTGVKQELIGGRQPLTDSYEPPLVHKAIQPVVKTVYSCASFIFRQLISLFINNSIRKTVFTHIM